MRLLDLFCGAGGAAMGYSQAGFTEIVGVDIEPQPNYPFTFIQADALAPPVNLGDFDLIHASPPCQRWAAVTRWRGSAEAHPDLVTPARVMLEASGRPYVVENVREAKLRDPTVLCGSQFGLRVRRHRYFETDWLPFQWGQPCLHGGLLPFMHKQEQAYAEAMGVPWMTVQESREAIPPAYTKFMGEQFLAPLVVEPEEET